MLLMLLLNKQPLKLHHSHCHNSQHYKIIRQITPIFHLHLIRVFLHLHMQLLEPPVIYHKVQFPLTLKTHQAHLLLNHQEHRHRHLLLSQVRIHLTGRLLKEGRNKPNVTHVMIKEDSNQIF